MKNIVFALLSLVLLAPVVASARPCHLTSVRWIVDNRNNINVDDRFVTLVGHVTRRIDDEEYWFADGTGQIRLDSENFDLPLGRTIVLGGRIDQAYLGIGHLEVDVRNWHYYVPIHRATAPAAAHPVTHTDTETTRTTVTTPAPVTIPAPSPVMTTPPPASSTTTTLAPPSEAPPAPAADTGSATSTNTPASAGH